MSRILFINRFYFPDEPATAQLLGDLAERLAREGHAIAVVTSRPPGTAACETHNGVVIHRAVPGSARHRSLAARTAAFAAFWVMSTWTLLRITRKGDVLVPLTDPPFIGVIAATVARLRSARVIHWVQDIYPEVAEPFARGLLARSLLRIAKPFRDWAWRRASGCVTLGGDMADLLRERGVRPEQITLIRNWPPAGVQVVDGRHLRAERGLESAFVVGYSGNLGRVHELEVIPKVAVRLRDRPDIVFTFTGGGAQRDALATAFNRDRAHGRFYPAAPRASLAENLAAADVHWVTLRPGLERTVFPSKFAGVIAAGRPVLFVGPTECELARIIKNEGVGYAFHPEEDEAIAACILKLAADPSAVRALASRAAALAQGHATLDQAHLAWRKLLGSETRSLPVEAPPETISPHVGS